MPKVRRARTKYHDLAPHSANVCMGEDGNEGIAATDNSAVSSSSSSFLGDVVQRRKRLLCTPSIAFDGTPPSTPRRLSTASAPSPSCSSVLLSIPTPPPSADLESSSLVGLSRGQKRRRAKKDEWLRKFDFVSFMKKQKETADEIKKRGDEIKKHGTALSDFSSIHTHLDEIAGSSSSSSSAKPRTLSRRQRTNLCADEISQFSAVWQFPAFQNDPFATLKKHLTNSLEMQRQQV